MNTSRKDLFATTSFATAPVDKPSEVLSAELSIAFLPPRLGSATTASIITPTKMPAQPPRKLVPRHPTSAESKIDRDANPPPK